MRKSDLVKACKKGWPDANKMVDSMLLAMNTAIINRKTIHIRNAFKIRVIQTKPNVGQNFQTGERIIRPSKLKAVFKLSPTIDKILNERHVVN